MKTETIDGSLNYQAEIVFIKEYVKHPNADKLWLVPINFNNVITGVEPRVGDVMIYFPVLSKINNEFLSYINGFTDPELNKDKTIKGFFTSKCRVKPIKLRGIPSEGYLHPIKDINDFYGIQFTKDDVETTFNKIHDRLVCEKYVIYNDRKTTEAKAKNKTKEKRFDKLVENQFNYHIDTPQLERNIFKINPDDIISITDKWHGTSFISSCILVNKQLAWYEKLLKKVGIKLVDKVYDYISSSRKVIKNRWINKESNGGYYNYDLWTEITSTIGTSIGRGITIYGEAVGFLPNGKMIQKGYHYNCEPNTYKILVYRITHTDMYGNVIEFTWQQIKDYCKHFSLQTVPEFYYGKAKDLFPELKIDEHWHEEFITKLKEKYLEIKCPNNNKEVWAEGIVLKVDNLFTCQNYKLKSWNFKNMEDKALEEEQQDLETEESDESRN